MMSLCTQVRLASRRTNCSARTACEDETGGSDWSLTGRTELSKAKAERVRGSVSNGPGQGLGAYSVLQLTYKSAFPPKIGSREGPMGGHGG